MFTTHEQLAVAQEREADLVAQLLQARNTPAPQQAPSCAQPQPNVDTTDETAIGQVSMHAHMNFAGDAAREHGWYWSCRALLATAESMQSRVGDASYVAWHGMVMGYILDNSFKLRFCSSCV